MSDHLVVHAFPPNFPVDDPYLKLALDEFNYVHRIAQNLATQTFDQLNAQDRHQVIERAQRLKSNKAPRSA